ncbi:DUF1127 domain-containing protein [Cypionkella sp.]|uniref:DUF1127 domain-containing protein n=1 Tax=Cypionkella sp. TaxID=2811411 RepID=UPI002ABC82FF|nr:DUF1127 domain-containing protein [Cypionkella sp.]MDZ4394991.1 DUF1127 domain-containing protein [Cypionkella sp.]
MFASLHTSTLAVAHVQSRGTLADLSKRLRLALTARRQRAQLARLDDTMLADIGVTPREAATEAARPAWDVPSNWLR